MSDCEGFEAEACCSPSSCARISCKDDEEEDGDERARARNADIFGSLEDLPEKEANVANLCLLEASPASFDTTVESSVMCSQLPPSSVESEDDEATNEKNGGRNDPDREA